MDIKKILLICLILISSMNLIYSEDLLNDYEYIKVEITNEINFELELSSKSKVKTFDVNSYFFPQTYKGSQYLNDFESTIDEDLYIINQDTEIYHIEYDLKNIVREKNKIVNTFILESQINMPEINEKIDYDLSKDFSEYEEYLEFEGLIDINSDIRNQASSIANGEDDVYIIASKVAKWIIEDIDYDLSSVLENPNQKSSEVFISKSGVCREITNLYISMMRSIGIPARVVSGFAYTNSEEIVDFVGSNWGGHAWAEVLIEDTWVPFDLTYNQYGFVDASHIVTDKHPSLRTTSVSLDGSGFDFSIVKGSLTSEPEFKVIDKKNLYDQKNFNFVIDGPNEIGFDSYGYIRVEVENIKDYYQILFLNFAKIENVETIDKNERMLIFKPNEKQIAYFRYKIPELEQGYIYTFPITIYNNYIEESYDVKVRDDFPTFDKLFVPELENKANEKLSNNPLKFNCEFNIKTTVNDLNCKVKNQNNFEITDFKVCLKSDCEEMILRLNEEKTFQFQTNNIEETLTYSYLDKNSEFKVKLKKPIIKDINIISNYEKLSLNYEIENNFNGLVIEIINNGVKIHSGNTIDNLIKFETENIDNEIKINLIYKDEIFDTKIINETIEERNFFQKILNWFINIIDL